MLNDRPRLATTERAPSRRGFTLAEVLLTLVLSAIVLGLATAVGTRLQHQLTRERARIAIGEQLAAAAAILPPELRALSPVAGDIRAGEARDTSLEIRATIGSALVCGGNASSVVIAPYLGPLARSSALNMESGDTLWLLADTDSGESWRAVRLQRLRPASGSCAPITDASGAQLFDLRHLWQVDVSDSVAPIAGAVARSTRPVRYSFYRAGDGRWYFGDRSWNSANRQFNLIQPISGPHNSARTRFRYYDSTGALLSSGTVDTRRIARVEAVLVGEAPNATQPAPDSLVVVVALRNRR